MRRFLSFLVALLFIVPVIPAHASTEERLSEAFLTLKEEGFSDVAAAAIVGNIAGESHGNPSCVEGGDGGRGIGVLQVSNDGNRQALEDYCAGAEHASHPKVTLSPASAPKSYIVCNCVSCQIRASLSGVASTMNARKWSGNYNDQLQKLSVLQQAASDGLLPEHIDVDNSWDGFLAQTDLKAAVIQFLCDYETAGATRCFWVGISGYSDSEKVQRRFIASFEERYGYALEIYDKYHVEYLDDELYEEVVAQEVDEEEVSIVEASAIYSAPRHEPGVGAVNKPVTETYSSDLIEFEENEEESFLNRAFLPLVCVLCVVLLAFIEYKVRLVAALFSWIRGCIAVENIEYEPLPVDKIEAIEE